LHAEEFVAGVFIASDRAAASVIHCVPKNSLQASVCVFSDRMMAHQHLESVVVRKKHVGGMGNTFSCFPLPS